MSQDAPMDASANTGHHTESSLPTPNPTNGPSTQQQRFATSINAFGLHSPLASSPAVATALLSSREGYFGLTDQAVRKVRRPSMLSLTQNASFQSDGSSGEGAGSRSPLVGISKPSPARAEDALGQEKMGEGRTVMDMVEDPSSSNAVNQLSSPNGQPLQPTPRWPSGGSFQESFLKRSTSASTIPIDGLKTSTPPAPLDQLDAQRRQVGQDTEMAGTSPKEEGLKWSPSSQTDKPNNHKGKGRESPPSPNSTKLHQPPFTGRPLPSALLQTLISESAPLEHEIQSEARLQRLLISHPAKLPLTPRAPRGSRGRFPEQVGGDDDDPDATFPNTSSLSALSRRWGREDSDSDSDDELDETVGGEVNAAFAAGMDMDRPGSSSSSSWQAILERREREGSGKSTTPGNDHRSSAGSVGQAGFPFPPNVQQVFSTPASNSGQQQPATLKNSRLSMSNSAGGVVPSPGTGYALPSAFGGLGMGTPMGSPTVERGELAGSPNASMSSPGLMQYRESGGASVRMGKRKAQEDRFDPYKRPRGTSPSANLLSSSPFPLSPSRPSSIPIPASPSHLPIYPSSLGSIAPLGSTLGNGRSQHPSASRPGHPYARPIASRSRAASPALSIGSGPGSLGSGRGLLGQGGPANGNGNGNGNGAGTQGQGSLGGLGLLSLANRVREEEEGEVDSEPGQQPKRDGEGAKETDRMDED
ncbi:hypothetical protein IAR50_005851 [Cryptococcus sp. DSM 104548]